MERFIADLVGKFETGSISRRDFYSSVLGMEKLKDDGKGRVNFAFGPAPGKGGSFIVVRNAPANPPAPARAVVDHLCYTLSNWNDARVNASLKAAGQNPAGRSGSVHIYDPFNIQVQLASAEGENPFI